MDRLLLPLLALVAIGPACSPAASSTGSSTRAGSPWVAIDVADTPFTAEFPLPPELRSKPISRLGFPTTMLTYECMAGEQGYRLDHFESPAVVEPATLDGMAERMAATVRGRIVYDEASSLHGLPQQHVQIETDERRHVMDITGAGHSMFLLHVDGPKTAWDDVGARRFIASLRARDPALAARLHADALAKQAEGDRGRHVESVPAPGSSGPAHLAPPGEGFRAWFPAVPDEDVSEPFRGLTQHAYTAEGDDLVALILTWRHPGDIDDADAVMFRDRVIEGMLGELGAADVRRESGPFLGAQGVLVQFTTQDARGEIRAAYVGRRFLAACALDADDTAGRRDRERFFGSIAVDPEP